MTTDEMLTTVGSTTLTSTGVRLAYSKTTVMELVRQIRDCRNAIRCLRRGTNVFELLKRELHMFRRAYNNAVARTLPVLVAYGRRSQYTERHTAQTAWRGLREAAREEIRTRRRNMRTVRAHAWYGFERASAYQSRVTQDFGLGTTVCGVHTEIGEVLARYKRRLRDRLYNSKAPTKSDQRRWVSVEIECVLGTGDEGAFCDKVLPYAQYVCIKQDGSIRRDAGDMKGRQVEIVVSAPAEKIEAAVTGVCEAIAECNGYVNTSCGLHIHLDMRTFDRHMAYSNLVAGQRLLRKLVPEHRIKNSFCKPVGKRQWPRHKDRYRAINHLAWRKYQTLEIRLFAGCINAAKICSYIKLCSAIAYAKNAVKRAPTTAMGWRKVHPEAIDSGLLSWVKQETKAIALADEAMRAAAAQETTFPF